MNFYILKRIAWYIIIGLILFSMIAILFKDQPIGDTTTMVFGFRLWSLLRNILQVFYIFFVLYTLYLNYKQQLGLRDFIISVLLLIGLQTSRFLGAIVVDVSIIFNAMFQNIGSYLLSK